MTYEKQQEYMKDIYDSKKSNPFFQRLRDEDPEKLAEYYDTTVRFE